MVLAYVEKNQFKSSGMQSIAVEAISWWVPQPHDRDQVILLFSDGEDQAKDSVVAARVAARLRSTSILLNRRLAEGPLLFREFAGSFQGAERLKETYSLAHLCMRGVFALRYDPSTSDYLITGAEGSVDRSVAVSLG
jgi:hypothetical protein